MCLLPHKPFKIDQAMLFQVTAASYLQVR